MAYDDRLNTQVQLNNDALSVGPTGKIDMTSANANAGDPAGVALPTVASGGAGLPVAIRIDVPAGATGNIDTVINEKLRVYDVVIHKDANAGGAGDEVQVLNGANAITDAMSLNVAAKTLVRPATIDGTYTDIAAGGTLRVTRTQATAAGCSVIVHALRVA